MLPSASSGVSSDNSALTNRLGKHVLDGLWRVVVPDLGHQHQSSICWASHGLCLHRPLAWVLRPRASVVLAGLSSGALSSSSLSLDNTWNRHRVLPTEHPSNFLTYFCPNFKFSAVLSFFFEVRIEPHVTFRVVFVRPNPKSNPTTPRTAE